MAAHALSGEAAGAATVSGAVTRTAYLSGAAAGSTSPEGVVTRTVGLSGSVAGTSEASLYSLSPRYTLAGPRPVTYVVCPQCGTRQVDQLVTRCRRCRYSFSQQYVERWHG